jgi:hypothetical protein
MANYYFFDVKDGVTVRDHIGISFRLNSEAIQHSKTMAEAMRAKGPIKEADLRIAVVDDFGHEIHVEMVSENPADMPA